MPHPLVDVVEPDERTVRTLLAAVPDLDAGELALEFVARGWDNSVWRVGERWAARIPLRAEAVPLLLNEARWGAEVAGPFLAHGVAASTPVRLLPAGPHHPYPWLLTEWVDGEIVEHLPVSARGPVAEALATTLPLLHRPAPAEAPLNPWRGVDLADLPPMREEAAERSRDNFGAAFDSLAEVLAAGRAAPRWDGPRVWCHGDLHPRNLLLRAAPARPAPGAALGVLDFGDLTSGDPATDLGVLWLTFGEAQRQAALDRLLPHYDDAVVDRARGWAARFVLAVGGVHPEPFAGTMAHARDQLLS